MNIPLAHITAGILAGGAGRRLDGIDKGWYPLAGRALIVHTLARVRPQAGQIAISANRSIARYRDLGYAVYADDRDGYCGPLAGMASLLQAATTPYVLIVPVDTPLLPLDLGSRLAAALSADVDMTVARTPGGLHPLHVLLRRSLLNDLQAALFAGVRRVTEWQEGTRRVVVDWASDEGFANINSDQDAAAFRALL